MRRPLRLLGLVATLTLVAFTLSGCSWSEVLGLGWPEGITPEGYENRKLWVGSLIAALVVGVIVMGLIFWTSAFHRHKKTDTQLPRQFGYNMPLEIVLTIVPFLIIAVLFYFTVIVQERMLETKPGEAEVVIDVTAFQWNWKFGYQQIDFSDYDYKMDLRLDPATEMNAKPEGTDEHGEERIGAVNGLDPQDRTYLHFDKVETVGSTNEIPILVLPKGKRIEFQLASTDVIHSFWVVEFLFKRDVMPNPEANNSKYVFQVSSIDETGAFVGRCAELCGTYHSMMNFEVRVVEPVDFMTYMDYRLEGKTNAEALGAINPEWRVATSTKPFEATRGQLSEGN